MKFSQELVTDVNRVHSYDSDHVMIQQRNVRQLIKLSQNFIIAADKIIEPWPLNPISEFGHDDIAYFDTLSIEVLILTQNKALNSDTQLKAEALAYFSQYAIGLEQMTLGAACRTFNLLISEGRKVALAVNF